LLELCAHLDEPSAPARRLEMSEGNSPGFTNLLQARANGSVQEKHRADWFVTSQEATMPMKTAKLTPPN